MSYFYWNLPVDFGTLSSPVPWLRPKKRQLTNDVMQPHFFPIVETDTVTTRCLIVTRLHMIQKNNLIPDQKDCVISCVLSENERAIHYASTATFATLKMRWNFNDLSGGIWVVAATKSRVMLSTTGEGYLHTLVEHTTLIWLGTKWSI